MRKRTFTIGRSSTCDVVLDAASVSGLHARLKVEKGGQLLLSDCGSKNGTAVVRDGRRQSISDEFISPTDVVYFGSLRVSVEELLTSLPIDISSLLPSSPARRASPPEPRDKPVRGPRLQRCSYCGAVKKRRQPCPECGR